MVVRYPETPADALPAWAGPLDSPEVRNLLDSPLRRQIASRLLGGESAVWVLVESGDKARDDAAASLLNEQLKKLEKALALPKVDPNDPDVQGPALRSSLPLKLIFSSARVSRSTPAEQLFVSMLLNCEKDKDRKPAAGPAIVPVFGRGRALGIISGKELTADSIGMAAAFLVGECSCQVKELNPGTDLLMAADWEALLEDAKPKEPKIPKLLHELMNGK
jgi:hypothetical protein